MRVLLCFRYNLGLEYRRDWRVASRHPGGQEKVGPNRRVAGVEMDVAHSDKFGRPFRSMLAGVASARVARRNK